VWQARVSARVWAHEPSLALTLRLASAVVVLELTLTTAAVAAVAAIVDAQSVVFSVYIVIEDVALLFIYN
jgi:hypothetical protein